jgi:hypothetical protein
MFGGSTQLLVSVITGTILRRHGLLAEAMCNLRESTHPNIEHCIAVVGGDIFRPGLLYNTGRGRRRRSTMTEPRTWITARLEGDTLSVTVHAAESYLDDDPIHRTRDVTSHLDLNDPAAIRSASAVLVPFIPKKGHVPDEFRTMLQAQRENAVPEPNKNDMADLKASLKDVLNRYAVPMAQLVRRQSRIAESAAYLTDVYDNDGNPILAPSEGLSGGVGMTPAEDAE